MSSYCHRHRAMLRGMNDHDGSHADSVNVKLHIDESVLAVAHKHYRIPFHLRTKVKNELNRLLDEDIIEEVKGPTEWLSPVVVVLKPNSEDIRICVDMRKPNIAIQ